MNPKLNYKKEKIVENNDHIITFDGKSFIWYSELPDTGKIVINQLNTIERDILQTKLLIDRHEAAKKTFIDQFKTIIENKEETNLD